MLSKRMPRCFDETFYLWAPRASRYGVLVLLIERWGMVGVVAAHAAAKRGGVSHRSHSISKHRRALGVCASAMRSKIRTSNGSELLPVVFNHNLPWISGSRYY